MKFWLARTIQWYPYYLFNDSFVFSCALSVRLNQNQAIVLTLNWCTSYLCFGYNDSRSSLSAWKISLFPSNGNPFASSTLPTNSTSNFIPFVDPWPPWSFHDLMCVKEWFFSFKISAVNHLNIHFCSVIPVGIWRTVKRCYISPPEPQNDVITSEENIKQRSEPKRIFYSTL